LGRHRRLPASAARASEKRVHLMIDHTTP
jgi:hypothetical protein